jgi:hypothetical protein
MVESYCSWQHLYILSGTLTLWLVLKKLQEQWTNGSLSSARITKKWPPLLIIKYVLQNMSPNNSNCTSYSCLCIPTNWQAKWIDLNCQPRIQNTDMPSNPAFAKVGPQPGIWCKAFQIYLNSIGCHTCTKMTENVNINNTRDTIPKKESLQEIAIKVKYNPNNT